MTLPADTESLANVWLPDGSPVGSTPESTSRLSASTGDR